MHRVVGHIDEHLDEPLELDRLAAVAAFSPYHFHRLFAAWMGETLGDYVRRRRVEVAAMRLVAQPRTRVLNIALSVGFGSAEAFTRAFHAHFGCSPTQWRKPPDPNSNSSQVDRNRGQALPVAPVQHGVSDHRTKETSVQVRILERRPSTLACLRYTGPYGPGIAQFWQEVYVPWAVTHGVIGHPRYGISHDDPGITTPERCRYDACAEVPSDFVAVGGAFVTTLPGGKYAVLSFRGPVEKIGDAWTRLLRDWLPSSGLQLDNRPAFEHYPLDAGCDPVSGEFSCEICVPVAPL